MITPEIMSFAQRLATSRHRFISDQTLSACMRQWSPRLSMEDARRAAIVADRIRRHKQAEEGRPNFSVDLVPLDAPIELIRPIKSQMRKARRRPIPRHTIDCNTPGGDETPGGASISES